jgi:hypothetical protein
MRLPQRVRPGDAVRAEDFNLIIDALAEMAEKLARTDASLRTAEAALARWGGKDLVWCRIKTASHSTPTVASSVTYEVEAVTEGWTRTAMSPHYGRPSNGGDWIIKPSAPGDLCFVVREVDSEGEPVARLWILRETIAPEDC